MRGARWLEFRRIIDAIIVVLALPILLPLAVVAMAAVFIEDRHSPIIRLERVGKNGVPILIAKIRSMRIGVGASITSSDDDRVTAVGRRLRSWRVDEIPQVLRVLDGSMALIGPRPESPKFVDLSDERWELALSARPAIAGMTQVIAAPWEASELGNEDPEGRYRKIALPAKLAIDNWYVQNASPVVDLKVVWAVFLTLLSRADRTPVHDLVEAEIPAARVLISSEAGSSST